MTTIIIFLRNFPVAAKNTFMSCTPAHRGIFFHFFYFLLRRVQILESGEFSNYSESKCPGLASEESCVPSLRMYYILALSWLVLWRESTSFKQVIRWLRPTGCYLLVNKLVKGRAQQHSLHKGGCVGFDACPDTIELKGAIIAVMSDGSIALYEIEEPVVEFDLHSLRRL